METFDVIRAWKDPVYRAGLTAAQRAQIPTHPAGLVDLSDDELKMATGGQIITTFRTCTEYTIFNYQACCH
jgi:mersacidin/lichenicidin family type 2 lantibiotic